MTDLLDNLRTPQQIAERITESTGVRITARTVWEKAKRLGVAKKIGRSMLVSVEDIPRLLKEETNADKREVIVKSAVVTSDQALAMLRKARRAHARASK
ncbi:hypothetical protein AB4Z13_16235 [Rhizobium sp. YAF28]|uniref:hypothetical protein n=1 Tax=Rhizobium sp. YAF28 TaxID=3233081 RepID=UPI003F971127